MCHSPKMKVVYLFLSLLLQIIQLMLIELELSGHDVIHKIVKVGAIDEALSLISLVHGGPAELVVFLLSLHEGPDWTTHHWDRLLVRHDQNLTNLIDLNSITEELTCRNRSKEGENTNFSTQPFKSLVVCQLYQWLLLLDLFT